MSWDWTTFGIIAGIVVLVIAWFVALAWLIHLRRKKRMEPSHIELYFDENFRGIIGEWDFVTRERAKEFKKDIGKRLVSVGTEISALEKNRSTLQTRMSGLEKAIAKMEEI
ncbi:MAG: hypothetical protein JXA22_06050 [Candidatus Thermoplasmatota archaeon]|nr:hypothetical protein [Candidatus Thermoplasmatota archaeon]